MGETTTSDAVLARLEPLTARLDEQAAEIAALKAENARLTAVRPSGASKPGRGGVGSGDARRQGGRGPVGVGILKRRGLLAGAAALAGVGLTKLAGPGQADAGHTSLNTPEPLHIGALNDGGNAANDESASTITTTTVLVGNVNLAPVMRVRQVNPLDDALEAIGGHSAAGSLPGTGVVGIGGTRTDTTFVSDGGTGVQGTGGDAQVGHPFQRGGTGVRGIGGGPRLGIGVEGRGGGTSGEQGDGVVGSTTSNTRAGVRAFNSGSGPGVRGDGGTGPGVQGESDTGIGVLGIGPTGTGVRGESTSSIGVHGKSRDNAGVFAEGPIGVFAQGSGVAGVFGGSSGGFGFWGNSAASAGLYGTSTTGPGVRAESTNSFGLHAKAPVYAGVFEGNVFVTGRVVALGGVGASATAMTTTRALAEDVGEATLANGKATVTLDPAFAEEIKGSQYQVFVTPHDASGRGLAVVARRRDGFDVQELAGGAADGPSGPGRGNNAGFSYRVVARLAGPAGPRQAPLAPPDLTTIKPAPPLPQPPKSPEAGFSDGRRER